MWFRFNGDLVLTEMLKWYSKLAQSCLTISTYLNDASSLWTENCHTIHNQTRKFTFLQASLRSLNVVLLYIKKTKLFRLLCVSDCDAVSKSSLDKIALANLSMWWCNRQIVLPSWKATDAGTFSSQQTERPRTCPGETGWCTLATWSHLLLVIFNQMITSTVSCYAGQLLNRCECAHCVANIPVCIPSFFFVFFDWQLFIANL